MSKISRKTLNNQNWQQNGKEKKRVKRFLFRAEPQKPQMSADLLKRSRQQAGLLKSNKFFLFSILFVARCLCPLICSHLPPKTLQFLPSRGMQRPVRFIAGACASVKRRAATFYQVSLPSNSPPHPATHMRGHAGAPGTHTHAVFLRRPDAQSQPAEGHGGVGRRIHDCRG